MPHCPEELELLELLEQHMLELELELLLPTHDWEPTIRLAKEVSPKPEAICGRTVTNRTKLAAAITAMRTRRCPVFMPHPPLSPIRVKCAPKHTFVWERTLGRSTARQGAAR
jgi:hypothetical protein